MSVLEEMPNQEELESLFVNNGDLHRIEAYLNRFNPIKTMRMEGMEIRHSAILAWLLDPRETHGFSDKFLRAFLCEAMRGQSALGSPTALEISQADLRDAEVRREWQNIDISHCSHASIGHLSSKTSSIAVSTKDNWRNTRKECDRSSSLKRAP